MPSDAENLFFAAGGYIFLHDIEGEWSVFLNDTWAWACADCEDIPPEDYDEVAALFRHYGMAGVFWWVYQKRKTYPEFPDYKEMILCVDRMQQAKEDYNNRGKKEENTP